MLMILLNFLLDIIYINDKIKLRKIDQIFIFLYLSEILMKIVSFGLYSNSDSFLRSAWNIMDFLIIFLSIISNYIIKLDISISSARGLRLVNAINSPKLKIMVESIIESLRLLRQTMFLLILISSFFAILGMQLFYDILKKNCLNISLGIFLNEGIKICGNTQCPDNYVCTNNKNPDFGATNFDNFFSAFLQVFRIMTFNNWNFLMNTVQKVFIKYIWIYFVIVGVIGNLFLINLVLAVVKVKHSEFQKKRVMKLDDKADKLRKNKIKEFISSKKTIKTKFKNFSPCLYLAIPEDYTFSQNTSSHNYKFKKKNSKFRINFKKIHIFFMKFLKEFKIKLKLFIKKRKKKFFMKKNKIEPTCYVSLVDNQKVFESFSENDVCQDW